MLRQAARQLLRAPSFTAVAVLTLGLGIGACIAIFTVVDRVLLRPPPIPAADRAVVLRETFAGADLSASYGRYADWRRSARSLEAIGALMRVSYNLTGDGPPVHPRAARISASALDLLGVRLLTGQAFSSDETDVVLLAHGFWLRRFGARPDVIGRTIQLDGRPFRIAGVLPRRSPLPDDVDLFTALVLAGDDTRSYEARWLDVLARLRPGVSAAAAQAELDGLATPAPRQPGWGVRLVPLEEATVGSVRPALFALLAAVGFLLLVACANVAHLLLIRGTARARELAVRAALGASRARLVHQLLVESLLLALLGAALGLVLARAALEVLLSLAPDALPRTAGLDVDLRALTFASTLGVVAGVGFGLLPAFQATRGAVATALVEGGRASGDGSRRQRTRSALVAVQVATALILLAGATLLMRSFVHLQSVPPGFEARGALITSIYRPPTIHPSPAEHRTFAERVLAEVAAIPGVSSAAVATNIPFTIPAPRGFAIVAHPEEHPVAYQHVISPDYFRSMAIPLLRGRAFDASDGPGGAPVAIVNQALASLLRDAPSITVGRIERRVVGVVGDVLPSKLDTQHPLQIYLPFAQNPTWDFTLIVRGSGPDLRAALASAITRLDPDQPVEGLRPLAALVGDTLARQRFAMTLFGVFSAVALVLAALGVYGTLAHAVVQRRRELATRLALGAQVSDVLALVLAAGARPVALGLAAGLTGALALTRLLGSLLRGVTPHDPVSFLVVVVILALVAAAACLGPALRAARLDPAAALRTE